MRRRIIPILKITIALVLFSSLAYALDKKKQARPVHQLPDTIHEEEALQAELLAATGEHQILVSEKDSANSGIMDIVKAVSIKDPVKTKK